MFFGGAGFCSGVGSWITVLVLVILVLIRVPVLFLVGPVVRWFWILVPWTRYDAGGYGIGSGGPMVVLVVPILFLLFPVYIQVVPRSRYDAGGSGLGSLVQVVSNSGLV